MVETLDEVKREEIAKGILLDSEDEEIRAAIAEAEADVAAGRVYEGGDAFWDGLRTEAGFPPRDRK